MKKLVLFSILFLIFSALQAQESGCVSGDCEDGFGTYVWGQDTQWAGDRYVGYWKEGYRHGQGTYFYASGAKYIGNYNMNSMQGYGVYYFASGDKYEGYWENGKRHGQGTYTWDDGERYEGGWANGERHGEGKYFYTNGDVKEGYWENGKYTGGAETKTGCISGNCDNGYGTYTWDSGEKYEGNWQNKRRNGQGTNYFASGSVYTGEWKDDKKHGYGTYSFISGDKYQGDWEYDTMHGSGTYIYDSGKKYVGEFKQNKFHGYGTMYYTNGTTESGMWENDKFVGKRQVVSDKTTGCISGNCSDGYGVFVWSNGERYEGFWSNQKRNGQGTNFYASGSEYAGEWKDDKCHGDGTYKYTNGDSYVGQFKNNVRDGQGTYTFSNGNKYVGEWANNKYNGEGTFYFANGDVKSGIWKDDKYIGKSQGNYGCISGNCDNGYGTYTFQSGAKYVGYFESGKYQGQGTYYYSNGDKYVGNFDNNNRHGEGTYTWSVDSRKYVGNWQNDKMHGEGTMFYATGEVKTGLWEDGKYVGAQNNTGNAPSITWLTPEYHNSTSTQATAHIKLCVESASELTNIQIYVNDKVQINNAMRGFNVVSTSCDYNIERSVNLEAGENKIKVMVENQHGSTTSDLRTITYESVSKGKRLALVMGNSDYTDAPLRNPVNDANAIAKELEKLGFDVMLYTNIGQNDMKRHIRSFGERLAQEKGIGLFYFAGHGMQMNGQNYLLPVSANIQKEQDVELEAVNLRRVLGEMDYARNQMNIIILDACRNNPFARSFRSGGNNGLATTIAPQGTFIAYATAPGSVAADGTGQNGLYTQELIAALKQPGLRIEDVFKKVRTNVYQKSGKKQVPWENSSIFGDFYFKK